MNRSMWVTKELWKLHTRITLCTELHGKALFVEPLDRRVQLLFL